MDKTQNYNVNSVSLEGRARELSGRSLKSSTKQYALDLAISLMDLTSLEGFDSKGRITSLCQKALQPDSSLPNLSRPAAVCIYPKEVPLARKLLASSGIKVASVATSFPSGQTYQNLKIQEVAEAVARGAEEIDMVIDRGAFLKGEYVEVAKEIQEIKKAAQGATLKVILETCELGTYENIRHAASLALRSGADFIKTSTGKGRAGATPPNTLLLLETVRDFYEATGEKRGVKAAGGVRTAKQALSYLVLVNETLGEEWLTPSLFRIGASTLLNDCLLQLKKLQTGGYPSPDEVTEI